MLREIMPSPEAPGWTRHGVDGSEQMRCVSCDAIVEATMSAAMCHHERIPLYNAILISPCELRLLGQGRYRRAL